jgi:predicted enzyme related to lactoylglutathione lyase
VAHQIVWVDIPVEDLDRAIGFYSAVLGRAVEKQEYPGMTLGLLPHADQDVGGCLVAGGGLRPSESGPLIYLNAQGRLDEALAATEANGGKVVRPKHAIGPYGFRAIVRDSEGNQVALHST